MSSRKNNISRAPASIQLLFNNEKLELMKVLCLMNAFAVKSRKQRKVGELLFYYSLVNFNLITLFDETLKEENRSVSSPNLYFRFQTKINRILLSMSQLHFVEIKGDVFKKFDDIKLKLLPRGKQFYEKSSSVYLEDLFENYIVTFDRVVFSAENVNKIKGEEL